MPTSQTCNILNPGKAEVIGVGRSGIAAAKVLHKKGWKVVLSDSNDTPDLRKQIVQLAKDGIDVQLNKKLCLEEDKRPDLIVVSPGVPWDIPVLEEYREKNIQVIGEIELAYRYLSSVPWIGITGTNGKTTTTALIETIFRSAGLHAPACGNIGYAACELILEDSHPLDWVIAEISSYQIESSFELSPEIGVWTTFSPDHLNRHKTLDNYFQIKTKLLERSKYKIFNGDDFYLSKIKQTDICWVSTKKTIANNSDVYLEENWIKAFGEPIMPINLFKMQGNHNLQNLLMAIAVARLANVDKTSIVNAITNFKGVAHRLEKICTIEGVDYINDSKATNYDAAEVGLRAVSSPVILIAGGQAKEGDDRAWLEIIKEKAAVVLLIGEATDLFAERFKINGYLNYEKVGHMEVALERAYELSQSHKPFAVLLSPACASFDQYKSFEERGDDFRRLSQKLAASNDILKSS